METFGPQAVKRNSLGAWKSYAVIGGTLVGCALHIGAIAFEPPKQLPFLHDALFVSFSFLLFASTALYLNVRQWQAGGWFSERRTE